MTAQVKATPTRSRRGQKQAIAKPDLLKESLPEGADLLAEKEVEAKEFKVGDRVQVVVPDGWVHQAFAPEGATGTFTGFGKAAAKGRRNREQVFAYVLLDQPPEKGKRETVSIDLERLKRSVDEPQVEPEKPATQPDLQEGAALVAEGTEFKVGDPCGISVGARVICRDIRNAMDDWIIEKITAKLVHVFSPSINQRAKLKSHQLEPYSPEKAFPIFQNGDRVKDTFGSISPSQKDMIFTVIGQHQNGMTSLENDNGVRYSLHCSQLALGIAENITPPDEQKTEMLERVFYPYYQVHQALEEHGFTRFGSASEDKFKRLVLPVYRNWAINVSTLIGGVDGCVSVDLINPVLDESWSIAESLFHSHEKAEAWAKRIIDQIQGLVEKAIPDATSEQSTQTSSIGVPCDISVGARVQVIRPEGFVPQAFAPEGATGTVTRLGKSGDSKGSLYIHMDAPGHGKRAEILVSLKRLKLLVEEPPAAESNVLEPEKPATLLFVNEGDRVRGKRASRGRSPITEGFVVSLGEDFVQLDTGKIHLAGIEIIERLQDQSPLSQITALLAAHGFNSLGHSSESKHADEDLESYEDWEIFVSVSNVGANWVDLIHRATCGWWRMFDRNETEDATAWAKTVIDRVEHTRRTLSGQLSLLESSPVESAQSDNKSAQSDNKLAVQPAELVPELANESSLDDQIDRLYQEATQSEETAFNAGKAALHLYRELGAKLEQRKAETKHGGWLAYLEEHHIQERKAQRAMAIARTWDTLIKSDSVTDLTLTDALGLISVKKLPAVDRDQEERRFKEVRAAYDLIYPGGFRENSNGVFPFIFEAPGFRKTFSSLDAALEQVLPIWDQYDRYRKSNPLPTSAPTLEEIKDYYTQVGTVKDFKRGFSVERPDIGPPFPLAFNDAKSAWSYWEKNGARLLELAQRKPMSSQVYEEAQETELDAVEAIATVVPNVVASVPNSSNQTTSITAQQIHAIATEQVTSIFEKLSSMGVNVAAIVDMADTLENSIREILEENLLKD